MRKQNNTTFWGVLAVFLSIVCFVVSYIVIIPSYKDNRAKMALVDKEYQAASGKLKSLDGAQKSISEIGGLLDQIFIAIPGDKDGSNTMSELESIAAQNSMYIPSMQIVDGSEISDQANASVVPSASDKVNISFSVTGTFDNISNFIKGVEKSPKIFSIKSLNLSAGDSAMTLSVQLESYKRQSTSLADAASTPTTLSTSN